jgi:hypothetical protein
MTRRPGQYVALVGLVMVGLCFATLFLLRDWNPEGGGGGDLVMILDFGFALFLVLGFVLGLNFLVVGLILALKKQSVKPS